MINSINKCFFWLVAALTCFAMNLRAQEPVIQTETGLFPVIKQVISVSLKDTLCRTTCW